MMQKTAAVYLNSFNYMFFVMKIQCVFCGVPTDLWSITKMYGDQNALPRQLTVYLLLFTMLDIG